MEANVDDLKNSKIERDIDRTGSTDSQCRNFFWKQFKKMCRLKVYQEKSRPGWSGRCRKDGASRRFLGQDSSWKIVDLGNNVL